MPWSWTIVFNHFPKILDNMDQRMEQIVAKAALDIQANAQNAAPVDTGMLRNSIQANRLGKHSWEVTVGADYGMYVEYGTVRMAAKPYFNPAIDKVRPQFMAALKGII